MPSADAGTEHADGPLLVLYLGHPWIYSSDSRPEVGLEKTYEYTAAITWECEVSLCVHGRERSISRFSTRVSTHIRHLGPVGVCDALAQISTLLTYTLSRRCTHTSFISQLQALDHANTSRDGRDRSISRFSTCVSTHTQVPRHLFHLRRTRANI